MPKGPVRSPSTIAGRHVRRGLPPIEPLLRANDESDKLLAGRGGTRLMGADGVTAILGLIQASYPWGCPLMGVETGYSLPTRFPSRRTGVLVRALVSWAVATCRIRLEDRAPASITCRGWHQGQRRLGVYWHWALLRVSCMSRIAVVGSGYVGTVVAACFAHLGHDVVGLEVDRHKLATLREGSAPFYEPGLEDPLAAGTQNGLLRFTDSYREAMASSDVVFICVGTPPNPDGTPNLRYIHAVASSVASTIEHYHILVNKSTVPIGTGQWLLLSFAST